MEVRYHNTLNQLVALQKYVLRNTETGRKMMLHRFILVEVIIVGITIIFAINHNRLNVLLGFLIVSSLAWLFRERSVIVQFRKDFKRERRKDETGQFDRDRILRITPDGLSVQIGLEQTQYQWDELEMAGRDPKHVYLLLRGVLHYVIPLSAFSDENEADHFLDTVESYRSNE